MGFIRSCVALTLTILLSATAAYGQSAIAAKTEFTKISVNIAPQPIRDALQAFGDQTGFQILFRSESVVTRGVISRGVAGQVSPREALERILWNTGLKYEFINAHTIRISDGHPGIVDGMTNRPANFSSGSGQIVRVAELEAPQEAPPVAVARTAAVASSNDVLQEVIVSAQKRDQSLQDVPLSVSVVNADTLLQQNNLGARNYLPQVPGVAIDEVGAGQDQLTIRGISAGLGSNPLVGLTIDDVPFGSSVFASLGCCILPELDPMMLDRIEVLRGPQGTLYGASAMGGLVKFVTTDPSATTNSGRAELDGSTVEHGNQGYGVRAAYSTPLVTDQLALQVAAFDRQDPGYINDPLQNRTDVNEAHVSGGRLALDAHVNDIFTVKLAALYQKTTTSGSDNVDVALDGTPLFGPYAHERTPGTDGLDEHLQFYTATVKADLGAVSLTSLTGYQRLFFSNPGDNTLTQGIYPPDFYPGLNPDNVGVPFFNVIHTDRWTQEFRVASAGQSRLQYVAGLFYSDEKNSIDQDMAVNNYTTGQLLPLQPLLIADVTQNYTQYAVFANVTYNITDRFDVGAGGRFSHNEEDLSSTSDGKLTGRGFLKTHSASSAENPSTYSFTGRYHIDTAEMIYARIASGFRAGGPNFNYPPGHESFQPDTTINYELGLKSEWLNNRLIVNPAVYYIDWNKIQVQQTTSSGATYYTNGGRASSRGLELSVEALPVAGLHLAGNVAYDDAKLDQDAPPDTFYGLSGDKLPYTAAWTANITGDYSHPIVDKVSAFGGVTATYTGARLIDFSLVEGVPRFPLPAYTTVDLRAGVSSGPVRATLFVRNVGDKRAFLGATDWTAGATNSPTGPWAAALNTPRTIGISLSTEF